MKRDVLDRLHEISGSLPFLAEDLSAVHRTLQKRAQAVLHLEEPGRQADRNEELRQIYQQMEEFGARLVEAPRGLLGSSPTCSPPTNAGCGPPSRQNMKHLEEPPNSQPKGKEKTP